MKPLVKLELIAAPVGFALIFASGIAGHFAAAAGADPKATERAVYGCILLFFCVFGFSCIGLGLHVFTALQARIGNGNAPMIQFLTQHETGVTLAVWGFLGVGTLIAAPFALYDAGFRLPLHSKGTLVADIGMTMAEVKQRSTIPWRDPTHLRDASYMVVEEMVFDFQAGDSPVRFPHSRYYWLRTSEKDGRLADVNIGITPDKLRAQEADAFERAACLQLFSNGWMPGHFVADSAETVRLWGGKHTTGDGRYWLKNQTVLSFERKRMDEEQPNEEPGSGEFIVSIHLQPKAEARRDLVFEAAAWRPGR